MRAMLAWQEIRDLKRSECEECKEMGKVTCQPEYHGCCDKYNRSRLAISDQRMRRDEKLCSLLRMHAEEKAEREC